MSSIRIKDLVEKIDNLDDEDLMVVEDNEDTKKIPLLRMKSAFSMDSSLISIKDMLLEKLNAFIKTHETTISDLEHRNKQISIMCANLDNDHIHDSERIFELENKLNVETKKVDNLLLEKNNLLKLLLDLQIEKDELSNKILDLKIQISNNEKLISQLMENTTKLKNDVSQLTEINKSLENSVKELEQQSSSSIDSNFSNVNNRLDSNIDKLMTYIRYYHPDVDEIFRTED